MEFRDITINDREIINKYIGENKTQSCENTFGIMYLWNDNNEYKLCFDESALYFARFSEKIADFYYPIGEFDNKKALEKIVNYCKENDFELKFSFLTISQAEMLKEYFGKFIELKEDRDWADYIYNYDDLMTLKGKKYHGQRNHINRFKREYPEHIYLPYKNEMRKDVEIFLHSFYSKYDKGNRWFDMEKEIMFEKALPNLINIGMEGGIIMIEGIVAAISFGEIVGDTLYVHFEKALREYNGIYAAINQYFCLNLYREDIKYVNREEDVGDFGLRTAKLSLHPVNILKKYFGKISFTI